MASATFEDHPADPDKVILRKKPYLDKGRDYEEGFVDGMQHQMQSSVYKAVNAMSRTWVGLTQDELNMIGDSMRTWNSWTITDVYFAIEAKLKEKNT